MIGKNALLALALAGCGTAGSAERRPDRLQREVEELRRRTDSDRHAVHELENRVFILEDKLDTAEVARTKTDSVPKLPVVTKPAPVSAPEPEAAPAPEPETDPDPGGPPIVIRLDGRNPAPSTSPRPRAVPPLDLAAITERLPVVPMPKKGAPAPSSGDAMAAYQQAYGALGRREHAVAVKGFRDFLARWPAHDYADNAQYWLGEAYYDQSDYQTALSEFRTVVKRYPGGNKAPDALLKVGFCMSKLGDLDGARDVLAQVADIYPMTDAARLATQRLAELSGRQSR